MYLIPGLYNITIFDFSRTYTSIINSFVLRNCGVLFTKEKCPVVVVIIVELN